MKLTKIEVRATPGWRTFLRRCYDNPAVEHIVLLNPDQVETYIYKGRTHHPIKPGIHHLIRPSPL